MMMKQLDGYSPSLKKSEIALVGVCTSLNDNHDGPTTPLQDPRSNRNSVTKGAELAVMCDKGDGACCHVFVKEVFLAI